MLSREMLSVSKRFLMLGVLTMGLMVFGLQSITENAYATICTEVCYDRQNSCYDDCAESCSATDSECSSCIATCDSHFYTCISGSAACNTGNSYTPHCQVGYADHCPIINGVPNCTDAHSGYYALCDYGPGGQTCVSCPGGENCVGANGAPPCF
jgi:hypothetical protein